MSTGGNAPKSIMSAFQCIETPVNILMKHFNRQRAET